MAKSIQVAKASELPQGAIRKVKADPRHGSKFGLRDGSVKAKEGYFDDNGLYF